MCAIRMVGRAGRCFQCASPSPYLDFPSSHHTSLSVSLYTPHTLSCAQELEALKRSARELQQQLDELQVASVRRAKMAEQVSLLQLQRSIDALARSEEALRTQHVAVSPGLSGMCTVACTHVCVGVRLHACVRAPKYLRWQAELDTAMACMCVHWPFMQW